MHEQWPLSWQVAALVALLLLSAFFSIAETAMMAINRYRLKHLVTQGHRSAVRVAELLKRTDRLLGGILIGNTLVIVAASSLSSFIAISLFDVGAVTVQDIMVPRARIEAIKLDDDLETISHQLATSYHMRLPVFRDALGEVLGVLHLRKVLALLRTGELDKPALERLLVEPYFVPSTTPVLAQLQYFQENRERVALVVDEYGELMGLVTLEDIIEEIIGKFTTSLPSAAPMLAWDEQGTATAEGAMPVRDINRALGLNLPTDGPKTLNGLIVEYLQDIPEAAAAAKIGSVPMEIVHAQGRTVKTVRIFRPVEPVENAEPSEA